MEPHETAIRMITGHDFCVLSTCSHDRPNTSLMQYMASADGRQLFMLTARDSTKFSNITANPHVSLLIDTRADGPEGPDDRGPVRALTVYGSARILGDADESARRRQALSARFPDLAGLAANLESAVIAVEVERFLLLEGVDQANRMSI